MPTLQNNHILYGLSGRLGNVVFRQFNGKTVVQSAPVRKAPFRAGELANQQAFRQAMAYAKEARLNPELWEMYKAEAKRRGGNSNANAVAVSDYRTGLRLVKAKQAIIQAEKERNLKGKRAATAFLYSVGGQLGNKPVYRLPAINGSSIYTSSGKTPVAFRQAKAPPTEEKLTVKVPLWRGLG